MRINGISQNPYFKYTSDQQGMEHRRRPDGPPPSKDHAGGREKPQGPPPGKGPAARSEKPQGPNLDTDGDGVWSSTELKEYTNYSSSVLGIELDSESIMNTYDKDGDGTINSEERSSLGKDNAFNLPAPQKMKHQMQGFNRQHPPSTQNLSIAENSGQSSNAYLINRLMIAYNQSSQFSIKEQLSTVTFRV